MTYDEAIAFWYGRINYEVRAAQPGDFKLERMQALLERLGNPHDSLPLVHITGTKGKGSTAATIASILRAAGHRVGLFTSPHLTHVEERIQVDGVPIAREELAALMAEVAVATRELEADRLLPKITFFEIGTALGFLQFARKKCDFAAIEVGLGGRFDSTNVCSPRVSIITNVGFDHMAQLGGTLEAIAFEKGGIIKPGVPVVVGAMPAGPAEVIRQIAAEQSAPMIEARAEHLDSSLRLGLLGTHQRENAACAVAAIQCLIRSGFPVSDSAIREGLASVNWPARIEVMGREPVVILDGAHNVPSALALVRTLAEEFPLAERKLLVFAVSSDKQYPEMLRVLAAYFDELHLTRYGNNPRCVDPAQLVETLREVAPGKPATAHQSSQEAWRAVRKSARKEDLLCVAGSVFLAGEMRPLLLAAR